MSITITLPTLEELCDFYAALPPDEIAARSGDANHCILAHAVQPQLPDTKITVSICEPEKYAEHPGQVRIGEIFPYPILATLTPELNAMAWDFDQLSRGQPDKTAAECVALIEAHIQKRDASASAPT